MPSEQNNTNEQSVQAIQEQLARLEADKKALEAALRKRRAAELSDFANAINEQITGHG